MIVTARAHPNIALIKYWGKRDGGLNLPAVGSISVTVGGIWTETRARRLPGAPDHISLGGREASEGDRRKISAFLDLVRARAGSRDGVEIVTHNTFPTAAGLASSASGFAALTLAAARLFELPLTLQGLSALARVGSGSAARSLHGGFVEWRRGEAADGEDSIAVPLAPASWWDLNVVVAVMAEGPKDVSSREGMNRTAATSPAWSMWVEGQEADLSAGRDALLRRDLDALAEVAEASCLKMAATWLTSRPPLWYWRPETVGVLQEVGRWRAGGLPCLYTTDAGPHVKVVCPADRAAEVEGRLRALPGVHDVLRCPVGGPATVEIDP